MTYEQFTEAMRILRHAKDALRAERGKGNVQDAIARNRALTVLNDAEFDLTGEYARQMVQQ